eukprot:gene7471-5266_t
MECKRTAGRSRVEIHQEIQKREVSFPEDQNNDRRKEPKKEREREREYKKGADIYMTDNIDRHKAAPFNAITVAHAKQTTTNNTGNPSLSLAYTLSYFLTINAHMKHLKPCRRDHQLPFRFFSTPASRSSSYFSYLMVSFRKFH